MPFRLPSITKLAWIAVATVALTACPQRVRLEVAPASRADNLVFAVRGPREAKPVAIKFVLVKSCNASFGGSPDTYWALDASDSPSELVSLTYGATPVGYRESTPARALVPGGCYAVAYGAVSYTYISIDSTGNVAEVSREVAEARAASSS